MSRPTQTKTPTSTADTSTAGTSTDQLIPLAAVDAYLAGMAEGAQKEGVKLYESAVVTVNDQAYVDITELGEEGEALAAYWSCCEEFWARYQAGEEPGAYMATRRLVKTERQRDNSDLGEVYTEALELPIVGRALDMVLEPTPDLGAVEAIAASAGGAAVETQPGEIEVSFFVTPEEQWVWGPALGGRPGPGELAREVRFWVRHAKWRDRKVRRLTRVEVYAHELWPQPRHG